MVEQDPVQPGEGGPRTDPGAGSVSRRDLMRRGLQVTPIVASFQPGMVMAALASGSTIRPSAFSSFHANGLRCSVRPGGRLNQIGKVLTVAECKTRCSSDSRFSGRYHNAYMATVHSGFSYSTSTKLCNGASINPTISKLVATEWTSNLDKLARYCAMAYMSAIHYGSASYMSLDTCRSIWKGRGVWTCGGVSRTLDWTLAYFDCVYNKPGNFDACLTG